jgi:hypothetical protein
VSEAAVVVDSRQETEKSRLETVLQAAVVVAVVRPRRHWKIGDSR